jgi:hypothetical protein
VFAEHGDGPDGDHEPEPDDDQPDRPVGPRNSQRGRHRRHGRRQAKRRPEREDDQYPRGAVAVATAVAGLVLFTGPILSTSALDLLAWTAVTWLAVRALRTGDVGLPLADLARLRGCHVVPRIDNGLGIDNDEQGMHVDVCRGPVRHWSQEWPALRHLG